MYGEDVDTFVVSTLDCGFRQTRESEQVTISISLDPVNDPPVAEGAEVVATDSSEFARIHLRGYDILDTVGYDGADSPLSFVIDDMGPFFGGPRGPNVGDVIRGDFLDASNTTSVAVVDVYYPAGVCLPGLVSFYTMDGDGARSVATASVSIRCGIIIDDDDGISTIGKVVLSAFFGILLLVVLGVIWKRKSIGRWVMNRLRIAASGPSTLRLAVMAKIAALVAQLVDLLSDLLAFASLVGRSSDNQHGLVIPYGIVSMLATIVSTYSVVLMIRVIKSMISAFKDVKPATRLESVAYESFSVKDGAARVSVLDVLADAQRRSLRTNTPAGITFDVGNSLDLLTNDALAHELTVIRREVPSLLVQAVMVLLEDIPMCVMNWIILYGDDNLKESGVFGASIMITMLSIGYKFSFWGRTYSLIKLQAKLTGIVVERKASSADNSSSD